MPSDHTTIIPMLDKIKELQGQLIELKTENQKVSQESDDWKKHYKQIKVETDILRAALGNRGRADCWRCKGDGLIPNYNYGERANYVECPCRKELGLS